MRQNPLVAVVLVVAVTATVQPVLAQTVDYSKAERFLSWTASSLIAGDEVSPNWIGHANRFWYRNKTGAGFQFVVVDAVRKTQGPLFDHARLAAAMSLANDTSYVPHKLPFTSFSFVRDESAITFRLGKKR
jgi:hypothetical protein